MKKPQIVDHNFPTKATVVYEEDNDDIDPSEFAGSEYNEGPTASFTKKELKALGF